MLFDDLASSIAQAAAEGGMFLIHLRIQLGQLIIDTGDGNIYVLTRDAMSLKCLGK